MLKDEPTVVIEGLTSSGREHSLCLLTVDSEKKVHSLSNFNLESHKIEPLLKELPQVKDAETSYRYVVADHRIIRMAQSNVDFKIVGVESIAL